MFRSYCFMETSLGSPYFILSSACKASLGAELARQLDIFILALKLDFFLNKYKPFASKFDIEDIDAFLSCPAGYSRPRQS